MDYLQNKTFSEIEIGDSATLTHTLTRTDIKIFALASGDLNPTHLDDEYTKSTKQTGVTAHSIWGGAIISTVLGTKLPGPGTVYISQTLSFKQPLFVGDSITCTIRVIAKDESQTKVTFDCVCINQNGKEVINGIAEVKAPTEKIIRKAIKLPNFAFKIDSDTFYKKLQATRGDLPPLRTAVVQPIDENSLNGVISALEDNLIEPVLVGSVDKINKAAAKLNFDISKFRIVPAINDQDAAAKAVELAKNKEVDAIMKGKIHTNDFMTPIVNKAAGLRGERRMSHVLALSMPTYSKPLFITDAAINIKPSLMEKRDIVQNAIELFKCLGLGMPKVAIVSAVETVDEQITSTLDATALCKMAERGQITGGLLDGPLAFDNAVSKEAAEAKGIVSQVAGDADIIVTPEIESGNMLYKQMMCLSADVEAAGIVVGAKVPIILTSRAENSAKGRRTSSMMALLYAYRKNIENQEG